MRFLSPNPELPAFSPLHAELGAAGAAFELRDGWVVPTRIAGDETPSPVVWADMSHLPKFEVEAAEDAPPKGARREGDAWWCPVTRRRTLVLGAAVPGGVDVTTQYGALLLCGPAAREAIARFCALDLRPQVSPPGSFHPGSVARTPGAVLVEGPDRHLLLFGAAVASYIWTVVADAGAHLGGRPAGVDAVRVTELAHA